MTALLSLVISAVPDDEDVVAGWTAFGLFGLGLLAIALLGFSLTKRLKNVEKAAQAGLYDPSSPRVQRSGRARGLAAAREWREQVEAEDDAAREAALRQRDRDRDQ